MGNFIKAVGSAFVGCFIAIWAFGKCKGETCKKSENFEKVAEKVAEKVEDLRTQSEQETEQQPTFVEVENEQQKNAKKITRAVASTTEVAQGIY